jgi:hypothetical protein
MQPPGPLGVQHVGLGPGAAARQLAWLDQPGREAAGLKHLIQRDPVDAGRLHGDGGDAALLQPVGDGGQVAGVGPEPAYVRGRPTGRARRGGTAFGAGTHTMCMSECTSMPAALGLRRGRAGACSRGGRAAWALGRAGPPERLRWATASATFGQRGVDGRRGPRGAGGTQFPQRDRRSGCGRRCASPRAGSPPLGPGCSTGKGRQRGVGHGPKPAWAADAELAAGNTWPGRARFTGRQGPHAAQGLHGFFRRRGERGSR